ncbi:hypothetical protein ACFTAO_06090 [Paenibacillus rhizoplanae]
MFGLERDFIQQDGITMLLGRSGGAERRRAEYGAGPDADDQRDTASSTLAA